MTIRTTLIASSLIVASLISGTAHAALEGRDLNGSIDSFEAYYDTDLGITWLADANNSLMNWAAANTWAANLSIVDAVNNITYADWRLPTSDSCATYYNCTGSDLGHLFYSELGGTAGQSILTSADPDLAKFTNLQDDAYWSATVYAADTSLAWNFSFKQGGQMADSKNVNDIFALAVVSGDVGIAAIPEPETYAMMLAGLGLVGFMAGRRKQIEA